MTLAQSPLLTTLIRSLPVSESRGLAMGGRVDMGGRSPRDVRRGGRGAGREGTLRFIFVVIVDEFSLNTSKESSNSHWFLLFFFLLNFLLCTRSRMRRIGQWGLNEYIRSFNQLMTTSGLSSWIEGDLGGLNGFSYSPLAVSEWNW